MGKKIILGICAALAAICVCGFFLSESDGDCYYTQVDNSKTERDGVRDGVVDFNGDMKYSYTLLCYNDNGKSKELTFGTSKELKDGAFICLTVKPIRGVIEWKEVQYNELPEAVQSQYSDVK